MGRRRNENSRQSLRPTKLAEVRVGQSCYEQLVDDHNCCPPPVKVYEGNHADWKTESGSL